MSTTRGGDRPRHEPVSLDQVARRFGLEAAPQSWREVYRDLFGGKSRAALHESSGAGGTYPDPAQIESQARRVFSDPAIADRVVEAARTIGSTPALATAAAIVERLLARESSGQPWAGRAGTNQHPPDEDFPLPEGSPNSPERLFYAPLFLARIPDLRRLHHQLLVPLNDTDRLLGDIELWIREHRRQYDEWGLSEIGWLRQLFRGDVIQLGRLQYEPTVFEWPYRIYVRQGNTGGAGRSPDIATGGPGHPPTTASVRKRSRSCSTNNVGYVRTVNLPTQTSVPCFPAHRQLKNPPIKITHPRPYNTAMLGSQVGPPKGAASSGRKSLCLLVTGYLSFLPVIPWSRYISPHPDRLYLRR